MARAALDFGCELNNYHGLFASYQAECGDLDYYVLLGPRVRSVTARSSVAGAARLRGHELSPRGCQH